LSDISQGWSLTLLGLIVAFSAMAIFIGVIVVLKRFFPYKEEAEEEEEVAPETPAEEAPVAVASTVEAEVAAIAVALVAARQKNRSPIGEALHSGRGSWWVANQLSSRQKAGLTRK
jgi:Na+-transporting methylmalonyl-CoA/oxaloacetate decarboxylase gamma subunit